MSAGEEEVERCVVLWGGRWGGEICGSTGGSRELCIGVRETER